MAIIQTVIKGAGSAPVVEPLNVTPTTSAQTITAPTGTDGYSPVNVSAVTSSIDANIAAGNIKDGVTILGVTGDYKGQTPTGTKNITTNGTHDVAGYAYADVQVPTTAPTYYIEKTCPMEFESEKKVDPKPILTPVSVSKAKVTGIKDKTYTGKKLSQKLTVKVEGKTLKEGRDFYLSYRNNKAAGKASVVITGKGNYKGSKTLSFTIKKAANPINIKAVNKTHSFKYSSVRKNAGKLKASKVYNIKNKGKGKLTYKKSGGSKKLSVSKSGVITLKKGTKAGTYKLKVKVTAAGDKTYKSGSKTVTLTVKVK